MRVTDDRLVIVAMPPLVDILRMREKEKGSPLTEEEVLSIRDGVPCIVLPYSEAVRIAEQRGYEDIPLENPWDDWVAVRADG